MSGPKQNRRDLTNDEIPLFELLKSTLSGLDDINVFAFSGRIPLKEDEKELLRSFPLSDLDAQEIYDGAIPYEKDGKPLGGRILTAEKFGLIGVPNIPSWVLNRVSGQYSSPIEYRLEGLFALGVGDTIVLPNEYTGGELVISKPENTEDGVVLSSTIDWSSIDGEEWHIKYLNQQVGKDVIKQRLLGIINDGSTLKEGGRIGFGLNGYYDNWVEELEKEDEAANEDIDEFEEQEEEVEANDSETEEEQLERWSKKYQPKPPRSITSEEEARLISELPGKLMGVDKLLLDTLSETGLNWHFEGVYSSPSDDEDDVDEVKEEVSEPDVVDGDDGGAVEEAVEGNEKLEDPSKQTDMWTSTSLYAIQGETISDSRSVRKALLEKGVKKDDNICWINIPTYYNNECWYKHEVNKEDQDESDWDTAVYNTVSVGVAIIIELPSKV
nr:uncharacterized protein I203_06557 [Kwoniella mangroviensis CBS 8507]OCF64376.1 hypothetical protein I203_06557 [Kwoniella mangroviensis CBS 8507]